MDTRPRHIELFAGAGGGLYASKLLGWRTVCAVEIDEFCQKILVQRQRDGVFEPFALWDDVRTFDGRPWRGRVEVVSGGFPCQPFSVAGKRRGEDDPRNGWPHTIRIIREVRPELAFLENVPGLLARSHGYFGRVLGDLAEAGYHAEWTVLGADDCGAPHRRKRLWLLAWDTHADRGRLAQLTQHDRQPEARFEGPLGDDPFGLHLDMADAEREGLEVGQGERSDARAQREAPQRGGRTQGWWATEPALGGASDGLAARLDKSTPHAPLCLVPWLMGFGNEKDANRVEALQGLRCSYDEEALCERSTRGQQGVEEEAVLQSLLREHERCCRRAWPLVASEKAPSERLRELREQESAFSAPCRREPGEQHSGEHRDPLRQLPHCLASYGAEAWQSGAWEDGIPRIAHGVADRVHRIKALGNGQVPIVAARAFRILAQRIEETAS